MPTNRLAYTKTPDSQPAIEGMLPASNPSNYGNATTKVINLTNNTWLSDSVVFTVDSAWRYVVHVRNSQNGPSSIHIDDVRVYGMNRATYLACDTASGGYRYGFNGQEKDDEIYGSGNSYDFGARIYDSRLGRFMSIDPLFAKYPELSPYNFVANSPLFLIDKDGREPIDPRTGRPFKLNLFRAAIYDPNYINTAQCNKVTDEELFSKTNTNAIFRRERGNMEREGGAYFKHSNVWESLSNKASKTLANLFPNVKYPNADYGAPNDVEWQAAAKKGTYRFVDDRYSESELFFLDLKSFNIISVEENYITQIVNLTRRNGNAEYNINSVTNFKIEKGEVQTREVKTWYGGTKTEKYRVLNVTEKTLQYKNNEFTGVSSRKNYTTEEIIE